MDDLTTVDRVKLALLKVGEKDDAILQAIVSGVSVAMQQSMRREISRHEVALERHVFTSDWPSIVLSDFPVQSVGTVLEGTTEVASTGYRVDPDTGRDVDARHRLVRISGTTPVAWAKGTVTITYDAGFSAVPYDLVQAATAQCVLEWRQTQPGGDREGLSSASPPGGGGESSAYVPHDWIPIVASAIRQRRRF